MRISLVPVAVALLALALPAQSDKELKSALKAKESAAKGADALLEVAKWAEANGLKADQRRILKKILRIDRDYVPAMQALGYVEFDGKWMPASKARILIDRERDKENAAKGMVKVDGIWVAKDEVDDAKRGVFHHDGQLVSRADRKALAAGMVRHPVTGNFIAAADLEKAEAGEFPTLDGWVGEAEANTYHDDLDRPWVFRTAYGTVVTTMPLEQHQELKLIVDESLERLRPMFGGVEPSPAHRPVIIVCATTEDYTLMGNGIGAEQSVYGAFIAEHAPELATIDIAGRPAVANWGAASGWGNYYLRHAAGLAYAEGLIEDSGAELPYWFVCGVGSVAERHFNPDVAKFFGQQHLAKGGVGDLGEWFADFEISAEVPSKRVEANVYQAGLLLMFCMHGGDAEATAAMQKLTAAFKQDAKAVEQAAHELEKVLMTKSEAVRAYLKELLRG